MIPNTIGAHRTGAGISHAVARAARYKPSPKTVCVVRLLTQLKAGFGVLDEAIPAPSAGFIKNRGETTDTNPMMTAGIKVGFRAHSNP